MIDFVELAGLADKLFEISDDDDERLAEVLDTLDDKTREALLASDLLNAYQAFYYYFRETPDELTKERLQLSAASDAIVGVMIAELDIYEVIFQMEEGDPVILLTDGEQVHAEFHGPGAYRSMIGHLDEWF